MSSFQLQVLKWESNCVCFKPDILLYMMFAKHTEIGHSLFIFWEEKNHLWLPFHPSCATTQQTVLPAKQGWSNSGHQALLRAAGCPDGITWFFRTVEGYANFEKIRCEQIFIMRIWQHPFENLVLSIEYI